ncbi:MAG: hypothetical protein MZW92_11035 [Comamonadaceae bacterium]|nr:hypothetical protein [Comamonadaceae bacterium]
MPHRQKTNALHYQTMRRNIASLAARLMAEDGISDYGLAKRKAARQLGAPETEALPNNAEIETELRAYQSLYQGEEQRAAAAPAARRRRSSAMRLLERFSPYLTGPVLDGTAGRYATVDLLLFPESPKPVEIFLLDRMIEYRHGETRRGSGEPPQAVLNFEWEDTPISVARA